MRLEKRKLGSTGFNATVLGIGDVADRSVPLAKCVATIHRAMDFGLNLIDTAPGYEDAYLQSHQWSFDAAVEFMLKNHVTLINDNIERVPPEAMPQLEKLARLAGARFVLRELAHERTVKRGTPLKLQMKWANVGVGKLHHPYALRLYLLDGTGKPVLSVEAKADPRDWLPGEYSLMESVPIPAAVEAGDYVVALALLDPSTQRRPWRLAIAAPENEGRYETSKVRVE